MTKMLIDIDDDALDAAQKVFGTTTKKDTVNRALHEATARIERAEAWAKLQELVGDGAIERDVVRDKTTYRPKPGEKAA